MMKHYNLYDLVTIQLDDDVSVDVANSVDFHLNYFAADKNETRNVKTKYLIRIKNYGKDNPLIENDTFHKYSYSGNEKIVCDPGSMFIAKKTETGFDIWCRQPNFLITLFIQILLLNEGMMFVHAAGIVNNNGSILFSGTGGVGKTSVVSEFVKKLNYKLLGDDIICIGANGLCYPFPRPFIIKEYHESAYPELFKKYRRNKLQDMFLSVKEFIRLNIPFRELIRNTLIKAGIKEKVVSSWRREPYLAAVPVNMVFGNNVISGASQIRLIIELVRYSGKEFKLINAEKGNAIRALNSNMQYEWYNSILPLITMSLFNMSDYTSYLTRCYEISERFTSDADLYTLFIPADANPEDLNAYLVKHIEG